MVIGALRAQIASATPSAPAVDAGAAGQLALSIVSGVREFYFGYLSSHVKEAPEAYEQARGKSATDEIVRCSLQARRPCP
ncbi:hypothetical protein PPGU19_091330 (plasmid) [Paraburkholderia sp. PGU19]|nr:hypothetical protein PPGU19_091330 [Paraburkholderia sp. PGU19]